LNQGADKTTKTTLISYESGLEKSGEDLLATEEPLEIRINSREELLTAAVTMRTPGNDFELALGFLRAEGIIRSREEVLDVSYCLEPEVEPNQRFNIVKVIIDPKKELKIETLQRHFVMSSACGVCGKASLEALEAREDIAVQGDFKVSTKILYGLPKKLELAQSVFQSTGGLHAAAIFTRDGELIELREDIGRHNAVDKLLGWALMRDQLPLQDHILLVSGRASFELLQKCAVAGISIFCAVSAPSSLAVELAKTFNITLVGFLRNKRFNVYSKGYRIEKEA